VLSKLLAKDRWDFRPPTEKLKPINRSTPTVTSSWL